MATFPGVAQRHRAVRESLDIEQRHINKTTIYSRLHIYVAGPSCYVSFGVTPGIVYIEAIKLQFLCCILH